MIMAAVFRKAGILMDKIVDETTRLSPRKFGGVGSWKSTFLLGSVSLFNGY